MGARGEGGSEVALAADLDHVQPQAQTVGGFAQVSELRFGIGARVRIHEHADGHGRGNEPVKHFELPRRQLGNVGRRTRKVAPGRLRLATRPSSTGLPAVRKTTGIVVVAAFAASAAAVTSANMTAISRRARSAAIAGSRS